MQLWQAISEMRRITLAGGEFSFSFVKLNRQAKTGGDLARISRARLRSKTPDTKIVYSSHKLFYTDLDTGRAANCWQILITEFNGQKIIM